MSKYVFSDPHFGHQKLFDVQHEPFDNLEHKHQEIIRRWNERVKADGLVYVLGDLGDKASIERILPQLKGKKILIMGNHDKYPKSFYEQFFDEVYDHPIYYSKRILLSHHPELVEDGIINIHGHTHLITIDKPNYCNVSVEQINYTPVAIEKFVKQLGKLQKPSKKFLYEWYADLQISTQINPEFVVDERGRIQLAESREKLKKKV
jgi:calcineurin-like phosphoesterase family protein